MNNYDQMLFGPIGAVYCNYFYYISVMAFVFLVYCCFIVLSDLLRKHKLPLHLQLILIIQPLLLYFTNRLHYSMCVGSLR